ncbi:MAG: hypothetical protein QOD71_1315 [Thermoleophilaceae bacterium]|jgi:Tfp pilus assembly protein PilX|nr:hypothetical protein [Thermoleophilaceae bacterium]
MLLTRLRLFHRCQQGFTTVTLMGVLMVGGLLVAASFAAVQPDIAFTQKDEDGKQAYAAAEAGLNYYLNRLGQDNSYYLKCDQVPNPSQNAVNLQWSGTGADPRIWQKIPGYKAEYAIELLAVQTTAPGTEQCVPNQATTMVDATTGTFRIRATGRVRTPTSTTDKPYKRSIVATLRRKSFIDFLWFTDYETQDPNAYDSGGSFTPAWAAANCVAYRAQRNSSCADQDFITGDSIDGPLKTNDSLSTCGSPVFGRDANDVIELNGDDPGWVGCGSGSPTFNGTIDWPAGQLPMPQSNAELAAAADPDYTFDGETTIVLNGSNMTVTTSSGTATMPLPANGVIYARNTSCLVGYMRQQTYAASPGCGNVYVSGTYNSDLTIGADNDIIIKDDLRRGGSAILGGLVANNFVRVYHPVDNWGTDWRGNPTCDNEWWGPGNIDIDAAILALNHSFLTDNWYCGNALGRLKVTGAIGQKFRGTVGTHSGGTVRTGYSKDYNYNEELRYREPPFFVNPTEAAWRIVRQNEQVPAR